MLRQAKFINEASIQFKRRLKEVGALDNEMMFGADCQNAIVVSDQANLATMPVW